MYWLCLLLHSTSFGPHDLSPECCKSFCWHPLSNLPSLCPNLAGQPDSACSQTGYRHPRWLLLPPRMVLYLSSGDTRSLTTWDLAILSAMPRACLPWISRSWLSSYMTLQSCKMVPTVCWPGNSFAVFHRWTRADVTCSLKTSPGFPGRIHPFLHSAPTAAAPAMLPCTILHSFLWVVLFL